RLRDAGRGRAAGVEAREVAGGRALDIQAARQGRDVERALRHGRRLVERQLERAVAAEVRTAGVDLATEAAGCLAAPDVGEGGRARVAEDALRVRVGTAAHDAAVTEEDGDLPRPRTCVSRGEMVQRHDAVTRRRR